MRLARAQLSGRRLVLDATTTAVILAATGATFLFEVSALWLVAGVATLWAFALRSSLGLGRSALLAGAAAGGLCVLAAVAAPALSQDFRDVAVVLACIAGIALVVRSGPDYRRSTAGLPVGDVLLVLAPGLAWLVVWGLSWVVPGASSVAWAMSGDSSNNVLFARDLANAGGLPLSSDNPVPLPHVLIALALHGDGATSAAITGYASLWASVIGVFISELSALGLLVSRVFGLPKWASAVAALATSALGWTWLVTGYSIHQGFFNAHLALVLTAASLCVALLDRPGNATATVPLTQALLTLLTFLTWTPLAAVPGVLLVSSGLRWLRGRPRRREIGGALGLVTALASVMAVHVVRNAAQAAEAFDATGSVLEIPPLIVVAVLGGAAATAVLLGRCVEPLLPTLWPALGGVVLALTSTVVLAGFHWSYYPLKMAWFAILVVLVLAVPGAVGVALRVVNGRRLPTLAVACLVSIAVISGPPLADEIRGTHEVTADPASLILKGETPGGADELYDAVAAGSRGEQLRVLVHTGAAYEAQANFWVVNLASGAFDPHDQAQPRFDARVVAYRLLQGDATVLCDIGPRLGSQIVVASGNVPLATTETAACPEVDITPWLGP